MRLKDKVAIVTGGATGIGKGITEAYAREGAKVVIACRTPQTGEAMVQQLAAEGFPALYVRADISVLADIDNLIEETLRQFGRIDILVNNAGLITEGAPFLECNEEKFDKVVDVNLKGTFFATQKVAQQMINTGGGKIIFISSNIAQMAQPASAHYAATKGGINSLVINLAAELGPYNICVNALAPGDILVEKVMEWFEDPAVHHRFQTMPVARIGQPEDVAGAAVFLASSESDYITGVNIPVDGGQLIMNWQGDKPHS